MSVSSEEEYYQSIRDQSPVFYIFGERVENPFENPLVKGQLNAIGQTYALANDSDYRDLLVDKSSILDEEINRFTKLFRSKDDLIKKVKMQRLLGNKTGSCWVRCTGMDMLNSIYIVTHEIDKKYDTDYHKRLIDYLKYVQKNDLAVHSGMTDVKGDRSLSPAEQLDPDMYLHIVEENEKGITVRGCKAHQTGSLCCDEVIVGPTRRLSDEEEDYAVSFAVPTDTKGIIHVYGRGSMEDRHLNRVDEGNKDYKKISPLVVFDNVFVPWERVFLCGENEFAAPLMRYFADFHRHSHGGCKCGTCDVMTGTAAAIAEYNGVSDATHIKEKLTEMAKVGETMFGCSLAGSLEAEKTDSGVYAVDTVQVNTSKLYEGKDFVESIRNMLEIAGGLVGTMPSEKDFKNPEIGDFIEKYLKGTSDVQTKDRMRLFRLIEELAFSSTDVMSHIHGGGSPKAHELTLQWAINWDRKKKIAKKLAGIKKENPKR